MNNLLTGLRMAAPDLSRKLEANFIEAPHKFEGDTARVALPLKQVSQIMGCIPDENLPSSIQRAVLKRKLSFIGGRLCAESALERAGVANAVVRRHESGAPIWPANTVGSITHTDQFAFAVASRSTNVALGIDSENIFSDVELKDVQHLCCTESENTHLLNCANRNLIATIIFSAKESLFKSIHASVKRFVDFNEIELTSIDWHLSTLTMRSVSQHGDLNPLISNCSAFFCINDSLVHTSVLIRRQKNR
jgi:enterobactin synthetase component D